MTPEQRSFRNPWLEIPLADYEGHMALPEVAQATLLADFFEKALQTHTPASVAVLARISHHAISAGEKFCWRSILARLDSRLRAR